MTNKPTILCVDDDSNVLDVMVRIFERLASVVTAKSGTEALHILRSRPIDLLVTDQKMPGMSGIDLVRTVRKEGIVVTSILLTAYTNPNDLIAVLNEGLVFRYVTKPWSINDLTMTVRNALAVAELRKEKERLHQSLVKRIDALNVMAEMNRFSGTAVPSLDSLLERFRAAARILHHDATAILLEATDRQSATVHVDSSAAVSAGVITQMKEATLNAHRDAAGAPLTEAQIRVLFHGNDEATIPGANFLSSLTVPLVSAQETVGTLVLFSLQPEAYTPDDAELLNLLVAPLADAFGHFRAAEREADLRIEQMVDAMGEGVVLTNGQGNVIAVNRAAKNMLNLNEEDPLGEQVWARLGRDAHALAQGRLDALREELTIDGRSIDMTVTPVLGTARQLRGLVLVFRDISEQKRLARRSVESGSLITQQLHTSLSSISGVFESVLSSPAPNMSTEQWRVLNAARQSTQHLTGLVDELLELVKVGEGLYRAKAN